MKEAGGDGQPIELLRRNDRFSGVLHIGFEVALPEWDRGVDLIASAGSVLGGEGIRRATDPDAGSPEVRVSSDQNSRSVHDLIVAHVRHVADKAKPMTRALRYDDGPAAADSWAER